MERSELRALAAAATPGPWRKWRDSSHRYYVTADTIAIAHIVTNGGTSHDAAYIAAADPATVLALLDENDRLRAAALALTQLHIPWGAYTRWMQHGNAVDANILSEFDQRWLALLAALVTEPAA